jgi:anthranilate synthase component 2
MQLLILDNYDSFTFNIVHALELAGARCQVVANNAVDVSTLLAAGADGFVISAGPCTPREAGVSLPLAAALLGHDQPVPLLGICLGHQVIAQALGARIVRSSRVMHGKLADIDHDGRGLFDGVPKALRAARYNSLVVDPCSLSDALEPSAWDDAGELMALRHRERPMIGLQFHPESALSDTCGPMLRAWIHVCRTYRRPCAASGPRAG